MTVYRKMISIITAAVIIICNYPAAGQADIIDFIKNGGFEIIRDGTPEGWTWGNGEYGTNYIIENDNPNSGLFCMKMKASGEGLYIHQRLSGLVSGASYTLNFNARSGGYGSKLTFKLEYYKILSGGKFDYLGEKTLSFNPAADNGWHELSAAITVPEGTYAANLLCRLPGTNGEVYYDDISFTGLSAEDIVPDIDPDDLPVYELLPKLSGANELISNRDFEDVSSGVPTGWSLSSSFKDYVTINSDISHSGSKSVKISTDIENNPFISYTVNNLIPHATYQIAVYLRSHKIRGKGFGIKNEYIGSGGEDRSANIKDITGANWMLFTTTFRPPSGCFSARLLFRLYGEGTVFIDDVSCYQVSEPYKFTLETDDYFYYTKNGTGTATVTANRETYPLITSKKVAFKLKKGGVLVESLSDAAFDSTGTAKFNFSLDKMTDKKEPYEVEATVDGSTETVTVYKYDRPSALNEKGIYIKDGKPFDPIFAYHVNTGYYPLMKEAGINVVQGVPSDALLSSAEENGLMVLAVLYGVQPAGHPANVEATKITVEAYKDHPALFAWAIMDEPFANDPGAEPYLINSYKIIREIDSVHPVFVMEDGNNYSVAAKCTDILGIDPYPAGRNVPEMHIAQRVMRAVDTTGGRKPVYCLNQAFSYGDYFPTGDEIRNMTYQALWAGAKAVGYYEFNTALNGLPLNKTDIWDDIVSWSKNESRIAFTHFVYEKNIDDSYEDDRLRWQTFSYGGALYVLAMNKGDDTVSTEIDVPQAYGTYVSIVGGGDDETVKAFNGGKLSISLTDGKALLLRIHNQNNEIIFSRNYVVLNELKGGNLSVSFPSEDKSCYTVLYENCDEGLKMISLWKGSDEISIPSDVSGLKLKAFYWNELEPCLESISIGE